MGSSPSPSGSGARWRWWSTPPARTTWPAPSAHPSRATALPGYLPLFNDPRLLELVLQNFARDYQPEQWAERGQGHGNDTQIADPHIAYVLPAELMARTAVDRLADGAREARALLDSYRPRMTREEYLAFMRRAFSQQAFDGNSS